MRRLRRGFESQYFEDLAGRDTNSTWQPYWPVMLELEESVRWLIGRLDGFQKAGKHRRSSLVVNRTIEEGFLATVALCNEVSKESSYRNTKYTKADKNTSTFSYRDAGLFASCTFSSFESRENTHQYKYCLLLSPVEYVVHEFEELDDRLSLRVNR